MRLWKDVAAVCTGLAAVSLAYAYVHFTEPPPRPINGSLGPNESPGMLYPACDYWPKGLNGVPCADSGEFERTGQMVFYERYPTERSNYTRR